MKQEQRLKFAQPRPLVVTEEQFNEGYVERVGLWLHHRAFQTIGWTISGYRIVADPKPIE